MSNEKSIYEMTIREFKDYLNKYHENENKYHKIENKGLLLRHLLIMYVEKTKDNTDDEIFNYLKATRNFLSHYEHKEDCLKCSFTNCRKILENQLKNLQDNNTPFYPSVRDYFNLEEKLIGKNPEPTVYFTALMLARKLPRVWINYLCDNIEITQKENQLKTQLSNIAQENSHRPNIDLSFLNWFYREVEKEHAPDNHVKQWQRRYMDAAWSRIFGANMKITIDGKNYTILPESKKVMPKLAAVRFKCKAEDGSKLRIQMSRNLIQQIFYYSFPENTDSLSGFEFQVSGNEGKSDDSSNQMNQSHIKKLYDIYRIWEDKKTWVECPGGDELNKYPHRHKATKSCARFLIRKMEAEIFTIKKPDNETPIRRSLYLEIFTKIQTHLDVCWEKEEPVNLNDIRMPQEFSESWDKLLEQSPYTGLFPEVYRTICDEQLDKMEHWPEQFRKFEESGERFGEYWKPNKSEKHTETNKRTPEQILDALKVSRPRMVGVKHNPEHDYKTLKLLSTGYPPDNNPYVQICVLDSLITEMKDHTMVIYKDEIICDLENFKNHLIRIRRKEKIPTEDKKSAKLNGYMAMELALFISCIDFPKDIERKKFGKTDKLYKKMTEGIYCLPGSSWDVLGISSNSHEGGHPTQHLKEFYDYSKKNKRDKAYCEAYEKCQKEEGLIILDNGLFKALLDKYMHYGKTILNWEKHIVVSNAHKSLDGYVNFNTILEWSSFTESNKTNIRKVRNSLFHFDLYPFRKINRIMKLLHEDLNKKMA